jgi:TRAP-type uncharacterized transport system substrate-binding protein
LKIRATFIATVLVGMMTSPYAYGKDHKMRICGGSEKGNYTKVANALGEQLKGNQVPYEVIFTKGSVDNLNRIAAGECDVGIAQNDAIRNYFADNASAKSKIDRMQPMYAEKVFFMCNREVAKKLGISRVPDIRGKNIKIATGAVGSGVNETWRSIVAADPAYGKLEQVFQGETRALEKVANGDEIGCMVYTSGLNSPLMNNAADNYGKDIILLGFDDKDLDNAKDEKGKPIYSLTSIPGGGKLGKLQPSGVSCFGSCSVKTAEVDAVLIYSRDWEDKHPSQYDRLVAAKNAIRNNTKKQFE